MFVSKKLSKIPNSCYGTVKNIVVLVSVQLILKIDTVLTISNYKAALKELGNCISRIIRVRSFFFCSIKVFASLHFLSIFQGNYFFVFLRFLCYLAVLCQIPSRFYNICIITVYIVGVWCQVLYVSVLPYKKLFVKTDIAS